MESEIRKLASDLLKKHDWDYIKSNMDVDIKTQMENDGVFEKEWNFAALEIYLMRWLQANCPLFDK